MEQIIKRMDLAEWREQRETTDLSKGNAAEDPVISTIAGDPDALLLCDEPFREYDIKC